MAHKRCKKCKDYVHPLCMINGLCNKCNKAKIEQLQAENEKSKRALRKAKALMEWADTPLNIKDFSLEWCITESMIKQSLKERS